MKCPHCGGQIVLENNNYRCQYCNSSFLKEELLEKIKINSGNFVIRGGVIEKYIGRDKIVVIPEGVTAIGLNAFINNLTINKVVFCDTLVSVEKGAFQNCSNLTEIANYQNVNYFYDGCFQFSGLRNIEIGENVVLIGRNAFADIVNLVSVNYHPGKNLALDKPFTRCVNLADVQMDQNYFFPFLCRKIEVKNNPNNDRPTYADGFSGTKFYQLMKEELNKSYKQSICPDCGGHIKKGLLHARCERCGIDYKSVSF